MKRHSSIHYTIIEGDHSLLRELIAADSSLVAQLDGRGQTPLDIAVAEDAYKQLAMLCAVLPAEDQRRRWQLACAAIAQRSWRCLKVLMGQLSYDSEAANQAWWLLARRDDLNEEALARWTAALEPLGLDVNGLDDEGDAAIHFNACWGRTRRVKTLLSLGCDPNRRDRDDDTPLAWAAQSGVWRCVALLLKAGADPNAAPRGLLGAPLYQAASIGSLMMVRALLKAGADVHERDAQGRSAIEIARYKRDHIRALKATAPRLVIDKLTGEDYVEIYARTGGYVITNDRYDEVIRELSRALR